MKVMLRGNFLSLSVYIKELGRSHTSNLTEHLKTLEQKQKLHQKGVNGRKKLNSELKSIKQKQQNNTKNQWNEKLVL